MIYLQRKSNVSKKLKSKTPLLIAIPPDLKKHLCEVPRKALTKFSDKTANINDWETLMFRMRSCYEIAVDIYVPSTQEEILCIVNLLKDIFFRYQETKVFDLTKEDIEKIEIGLDAMDTMQDQVTRKDMLEPFYRTQKYMKQYVFA